VRLLGASRENAASLLARGTGWLLEKVQSVCREAQAVSTSEPS